MQLYKYLLINRLYDMKFKITYLSIVSILMLNVVSTSAQYGTVSINNSIKSEILDRDMSYSVYLPESYHSSDRSYPVLYLLHGMTDNHSAWVHRGEVHHIAGKAMASNEAPEMIIVMPDGLYDAFYINNYDGSIRWEDFFHEEFMPQIENKYRIIGHRNNRTIAGLSMGGYGALYHAVKYKEKFSAVYAMSGAFLEVEPMPESERSDWDRDFHLKTWGPYNSEGYPENYHKHSVQEIFRTMEPIEVSDRGWSPWGTNEVPLPFILIDCGDDDFLLRQNTNLVHIMRSKNVRFEFRVRDGGHTWDYWRTSLAETLKFVGDVIRN